MSLYRDEGVVLRTSKLGEADRIITILTRGHGKIRAVAKGVRRTKSRFVPGSSRSCESMCLSLKAARLTWSPKLKRSPLMVLRSRRIMRRMRPPTSSLRLSIKSPAPNMSSCRTNIGCSSAR